MTDIINTVKQFTEAVGCTTDQYNVRQTALYIGLQLEEMAEKLEACGNHVMAKSLHALSSQYKNGGWDFSVKNADRAAMLNADIDLAWVTIGSAFSQGADVEGAAREVARANMSKLVMCDGCKGEGGHFEEQPDGSHLPEACQACNGLGLIAFKDENGKVKKPAHFVPPNIEPFIYKGK